MGVVADGCVVWRLWCKAGVVYGYHGVWWLWCIVVVMYCGCGVFGGVLHCLSGVL